MKILWCAAPSFGGKCSLVREDSTWALAGTWSLHCHYPVVVGQVSLQASWSKRAAWIHVKGKALVQACVWKSWWLVGFSRTEKTEGVIVEAHGGRAAWERAVLAGIYWKRWSCCSVVSFGIGGKASVSNSCDKTFSATVVLISCLMCDFLYEWFSAFIPLSFHLRNTDWQLSKTLGCGCWFFSDV